MLHTAKHPIFIALTLRFTIYSTRIITKLPILAPPERHCRSVFNRTGASKCTSAFSCFILFCPLFVQVGVISVWWFYHFHSAIFIIFCYLRYFLSGATVISFQGCISLAVSFISQYLRHFCSDRLSKSILSG